MDTDGLIRAVASTCDRLAWDRTMVIRFIGVEAAIPASFQSNIRIVHRLQVEAIDRAWDPDIGGITVGDLSYGIVDADIENVPLRRY